MANDPTQEAIEKAIDELNAGGKPLGSPDSQNNDPALSGEAPGKAPQGQEKPAKGRK